MSLGEWLYRTKKKNSNVWARCPQRVWASSIGTMCLDGFLTTCVLPSNRACPNALRKNRPNALQLSQNRSNANFPLEDASVTFESLCYV